MDFRSLLKRYNQGLQRGAQVRLAKALGVTEGVVSRWANGELMPGEEIRPKLAKLLGVSEQELGHSLKPSGPMSLRERGPEYGDRSIYAEAFPEALRAKIEREAAKRMLPFDMVVTVLLGEYFGGIKAKGRDRSPGTADVDQAEEAPPERHQPDAGHKRRGAA